MKDCTPVEPRPEVPRWEQTEQRLEELRTLDPAAAELVDSMVDQLLELADLAQR